MTVRTRIAAFVFAVGLTGVSAVQAQESVAVDAALAKRGKSLFTNKGCTACHTIGKGKRSGPDLAGVMARRETDWLRQFLTDPSTMFTSDETAKALLDEYRGVKMPNLKLKAEDIEALLHYIQQESDKAVGGSDRL